jgi:hypothetical protein
LPRVASFRQRVNTAVPLTHNERRWLVPVLSFVTAEVSGWSISDAMQRVSMFGYVILGPLLFLLLRRRFPIWPSIAGAMGCLLLPPLYRWSFGQFVDSWGLALMTLGLLALVLGAGVDSRRDLAPPRPPTARLARFTHRDERSARAGCPCRSRSSAAVMSVSYRRTWLAWARSRAA